MDNKTQNLSINNINKSFDSHHVLKDISLTINEGEFVSILGPSGCGKTTLLRIIAGLETACSGNLDLGGEDITKTPVSQRGFGIVFQSYALFPNLTVAKNVAYGMKKASKAEKTARVKEMLDLVGLEGIENKYPAQLSGGMQQRVALARALAVKPRILLLDEPLSALDAKVRTKLREEICRIQKEVNLTTIMVTHDQEEALTMADRVVVMDKGNIKQFDTPINLYNKPANEFVADFVGHMNFLEQWDCCDEGLLHSSKDLKAKKTLAFRPEAVELIPMDDMTRPAIKATVEYIEFRGSFYRVQVSLSQEEHRVEFDLQPSVMAEFQVQVGQTVRFRIQKDELHSFVNGHSEVSS